MSTAIEKPADLDPTVWHSRDDYRQWQARMADYAAAVRAEEARQREEQEKRDNPPPQYPSDAEYDRIKRAEHEAEMARRKQHADEQAAKEKARADYLASTPDIAEIRAADPFSLLTEVTHWAAKGYSLPEDGIQFFVQGCYTVQMVKPTTPARKR
ncbi:hypothetical protein [Cupriavidus plantarum]|uniref:Uncharacterized protein n=1 Tax=Cupriavidus plantarum TaxID=942865 RepID=A0A316F1V9_9BURK|nr:hypothetical protein [Cupriavidus plantarum]PWK38671.1 hypothetical protein C7419_1012570 [Cupriavidus plantarum]